MALSGSSSRGRLSRDVRGYRPIIDKTVSFDGVVTAKAPVKARTARLTTNRHKVSAVAVAVVMFASFMAVLMSYSGPMASLTYHAPISIASNDDFQDLYGFPGSGTESDPYVIEGFEIYTNATDGTYAGIEVVGTTAHFVIRGVQINSTGDSMDTAVYLEDVSNATIESSRMNNTAYGFEIYDSDNVTVWDVTISNCTGELLYIEVCEDLSVTDSNFYAETNQWIWGYGISRMIVSGNEVNGTDTGAYLSYVDNVTVDSNSFESCDYPILLYDSQYCEVTGNTMSGGSGEGITVGGSFMCEVSGNVVSEVSAPGIYSSSCHDVLFSSNTISDCSACGIFLAWTVDCVVYNNTLTNNDDTNHLAGGVYLEDCARILVYHNGFYGNTPVQAYDYGGTGNRWNATYPTGGNYWDDYAGDDTSPVDGIGDTPYPIDANTEDSYPLMEPPTPSTPIPEFTSVIVPVLAMMVLFLLVHRRRSA